MLSSSTSVQRTLPDGRYLSSERRKIWRSSAASAALFAIVSEDVHVVSACGLEVLTSTTVPAVAASVGRVVKVAAESTIAAAYLAGEIDRETAIDQLQTYQLTGRDRAEQRLSFIETYRSYIINYGLGRDMVEAWVERQGGTQDQRWAAMGRLLSSQMLPPDLDGPAAGRP